MVVGVEELGHVKSTGPFGSTGHRKVLVQTRKSGEARRSETEVKGPVEDLVVEGAVEAHEGDAGVGLELPGSGLDVGGDLEELLLGDALLPVAVVVWREERRVRWRLKKRKKEEGE